MPGSMDKNIETLEKRVSVSLRTLREISPPVYQDFPFVGMERDF